jgi:UTP--glucose-1-phosphate uridylyltransferase
MPRVTKAVIPAAGFGTRFLPATKAQPKEMLTVVDKPVIQYIVEEAVAAGITDIIIITGQAKRAIEDHFDHNYELEAKLKAQGKTRALREVQRIARLATFVYIRQREALGDGQALLEAASLLRNEPFAVLFGDDIIDSPRPALKSLIDAYQRYGAPVVGVSRVPRAEVPHYGVIAGSKVARDLYRVTAQVEKPTVRRAPSNLAVCGRYVLTPQFLDVLKRQRRPRGGELRTGDAVPAYLKRHPFYAAVCPGKWYDCGSKLGLLKATVAYGRRRPDVRAAFRPSRAAR